MGEKEELIKKIQEAAEEKGFTVRAGPLRSKSTQELRQELERIKQLPRMQGTIAVGEKVKSVPEAPVRIEKKHETEERKTKIEPTNPFNIPTGDRRKVRKWFEEHLDLLTSERFRKWAYSPGGKKFLHKWGSTSWELLEVLREARKKKEEIENIVKWMEEKAGKPRRLGVKKARTMEELEEQVRELEERKKQLLEKEAQLTGFLELRKRTLMRMEEAKRKLRKKRI